MDPVRNPYAPGAGTPPPELAGRGDVIEAGTVALQRVAAGRPTQSIILVGLVTSVAPTRSALIRKGMIYSPAHGDTAFTVPLFDRYMKRAMPLSDDPLENTV